MITKTNFAPSRRALVLIATASLALAGCGIGPTNPPAQIYVLDPDFTALPDAPKVDWGLAIARPDVADVHDTQRLALQRGQTMDYYADAQWTDSAPRLLQSLLVEAFEKSAPDEIEKNAERHAVSRQAVESAVERLAQNRF